MKISVVRDTAKSRRMKIGKMDKAELEIAIQGEEGNNDCFAAPYVREFNQRNCLWR